jgi:hypothetical protein
LQEIPDAREDKVKICQQAEISFAIVDIHLNIYRIAISILKATFEQY